MPRGDENGKRMRDLGEHEGLTLVCRGPAGVCSHSTVSPDELPDVIFLGTAWVGCGCKALRAEAQLVAQGRACRRDVGLRSVRGG